MMVLAASSSTVTGVKALLTTGASSTGLTVTVKVLSTNCPLDVPLMVIFAVPN